MIKSSKDLNFPESAEKFPEEVDVEFAAKYLGVSPRTIVNYLNSKQLDGIKVAKKWFVKKSGLLKIKPLGASFFEALIPDEENPLSKHQLEMKNRGDVNLKKWELKKLPRRTPNSLLSFSRARESVYILNVIKDELDQANYEFYKKELESITDDIAAGFYSYGILKIKLYGRSRMKAGRIVGRAMVNEMPKGFCVSLIYLVEAIGQLIRKIEVLKKTKDEKNDQKSL